MSVICRFSPSPTGYLHVGNMRTALINYLYAKAKNGEFYLRIDDTDLIRSKDLYKEAIFKDLEWLGLEWDKLIIQSKRLEIYDVYIKKLLKQGAIYPCYETEAELLLQKKLQLKQNLPPIYDRLALNLTKQKKFEYEQENRKPYYRFLLGDKKISWVDQIKGNIEFKKRAFSDPVVLRADNSPTYTFTSVIDDILHNVSTIIRGEDHITNTAIQIQIFASISDKIPEFAHLSLLKTKQQALSKRIGGFEIFKLREIGILPITIINYLSKIGSSDNVNYDINTENIVNSFDMNKFSKSYVLYNEKDLVTINRKIISKYSYNDMLSIFKQNNLQNIDEKFWNSVKDNIDTINDIKLWQDICNINFQPSLEKQDIEFLTIVKDLLPDKWENNSWNDWINQIKIKTGRKGKELFHPIRIALTNTEQGPELSKLIPIIGLDKVKKRLSF